MQFIRLIVYARVRDGGVAPSEPGAFPVLDVLAEPFRTISCRRTAHGV